MSVMDQMNRMWKYSSGQKQYHKKRKTFTQNAWYTWTSPVLLHFYLCCVTKTSTAAPRSSRPRTHFTISVSFVIANVVTQRKSRFNFENLFTFKWDFISAERHQNNNKQPWVETETVSDPRPWPIDDSCFLNTSSGDHATKNIRPAELW